MIFVFGSNLAGRHGKGAARTALIDFGAIYGQGEGPQGNSYAIPTKDYSLKTLPISRIRPAVDRFIEFAKNNTNLTFYVTRVGCGLAGYKEKDIRPLFEESLAKHGDAGNLIFTWEDEWIPTS